MTTALIDFAALFDNLSITWKKQKLEKKFVKWLCWHFCSLIMDLSGFKGDSYLFLKLIHLQIRISLELDISDICLRINKLLVSKTRNCSSFWNSFYSCLLKLLVPELKIQQSTIWYAGSLGQMTRRPSVWCSKYYFS